MSSNNEFAQDGPLPSWLTVYGVDGADPPHIEEHPVAFAIIILSPNNWVTNLMYGVSPHPAQAPENSISGCLNWLPLTVVGAIISPLGATLVVSTANAQFSTSTSWVSRGFITKAFCLAGHMSAQFPHPVQSIGLTCILYCNPSNPLPIAFLVLKLSGALAASSSFTNTGLIHAWGQTYAHWLHWIQLSVIHSGTLTATPRFSYAAVPAGNVPSSKPSNALTGKLLPSWAFIGLNMFFMNSGSSESTAISNSSALDQLAGTSILTKAFNPASTASKFMLTTFSPFLP